MGQRRETDFHTELKEDSKIISTWQMSRELGIRSYELRIA